MYPSSIYLFLWTVGCALGFLAALLVLHHRRALTSATAFTTALAWLFLFVGSKWHSRLESLPWTEALLVSPAELFTPGRRLPLGLLTSGVAAALCCLALRVPWRDVGDALAVFWSVLIPVGRIGCMTYGCCLGTVCGAWLRPLGWRYGPGSEAFHLQLVTGILPSASTVSLPVHPLPLYFALASLGTLAILFRLLRREAPPGTLLLVFCLLRPATKLALEPLRSEPAPPWLMIGIPAATLVVAIAVSARLLLRRRLATATLLPLASLALTTSIARGDEMPWSESLTQYAQNPLRNRRLLRRLEREEHGTHPPLVLLALADARLRSGSFAAAERLFARAAAANPEEPFSTWALLGRTWSRLLAGETPEEAGRAFAVAVDDASTSPGLRAAAQLATAYERYWAGDDAIAAFDAAVDAADGNLVDDARYGAARARLRAGDVGSALPMLRDLATWHANGRPGCASPALVALDPKALLRAGFERYRRGAVGTPEQQLHLMLDGDGAALARAALRELGEPGAEPRPAPRAHALPTPTRPLVARAPVRPETPARFHPPLDVVAAWSRRLLLGAAALVALLLTHIWWDRRIPPGGRHGSRTD